MRKIIFSIILTIIMLPSICFAEPIIKSDSRTFDIIKGVYDLRGNVFVQFPVRGSNMTITGDITKVYMYQQEVHGSGNITLSFDNMKFSCDNVDVYSNQRIAYLEGNMNFNSNDLNITSDSGSYNWKTKIAIFNGNVKVNGESKPNNTKYNMETKSFIE